MKFIAPVLAAALIAGCATPPGKLKPEDLSWHSFSVGKPAAEVFTALQNYSRVCGGLLGGNYPEWYPGPAGGTSRIDLHLVNAFGSRSNFVYGLIEITGHESSEVKIGVQRVYARPVFGKPDGWKDRATVMLQEIDSNSTPSCP